MGNMLGFEQYRPGEWLEGIFSVHLHAAKAGAAVARRSGKWAGKGLVGAAVALTGTAFIADVPAVPTRAVTLMRGLARGVVDMSSDFAPFGYFSSLRAVLLATERLPVQSLVDDPEFSF